jgi:site-specific DNA recombinase
MNQGNSRTRRCAIYTRKSSEEGLEQDFNSLHAQRMVEVFDAHGVSFVAVTQQFNTTTSMGRLTLNVLLSFAQFEREVTGERIRDKIAASKRKGMWMGGVPPLGYDIRDRRLVISPVEAETVRQIYQRYLELGSVRLLQSDLDRRGIVSKKGAKSGGHSFSRGALYKLLSNPIYIGEIRHRKESHPGQHAPILERELCERAQDHLRNHVARHRERPTKALPSPLAGKLFDENSEPLYAQGASKGGRRYRYYVSRALVRGSAKDAHGGWRVAAPEIERAVTIASRQLLEDQTPINEAVGASVDFRSIAR